MTLALALLAACAESKVPEDAIAWSVTVTGATNTCHPDNTQGYQDTFEYRVAFDASSATLYIGEDAFASGTIVGCDLTYQSVVVGETKDGVDIKWQLFGQAAVESTEGNSCVENPDAEWEGTEYFEIVASEDPDQVAVGCEYTMTTLGTLAE